MVLGKLPPTPRLALSQTLTLTGEGRFFSEAILWLPPNPETNPDFGLNLQV